MAINTNNYNLKKPSSEDFYNVEDQNGNMDIIDQELKRLNEDKAGVEHNHNGVYETPNGAQSKVDAAKVSANQYTDQKFTTINSGLSSHLSDTTSAHGINNKVDSSIYNNHVALIASESIKGHLQIANTTEVLNAIEATKVITPATLESKLVDYGNIVNKSASFIIALTDRNKTIVMTGTATQTVTIPANSSVAFKVGTQIIVIQQGTGTVTFTPASAVTLYSKDTKRIIDGQYTGITLIKTATDTWLLVGALK